MSGPNDFHGEVIDGVWTQLPGLGSDEPQSDLQKLLANEPPNKRELRQRATELDALAESLAAQTAALAAAQAAFAAKTSAGA